MPFKFCRWFKKKKKYIYIYKIKLRDALKQSLFAISNNVNSPNQTIDDGVTGYRNLETYCTVSQAARR